MRYLGTAVMILSVLCCGGLTSYATGSPDKKTVKSLLLNGYEVVGAGKSTPGFVVFLFSSIDKQLYVCNLEHSKTNSILVTNECLPID
jgi:hypothetical protein